MYDFPVWPAHSAFAYPSTRSYPDTTLWVEEAAARALGALSRALDALDGGMHSGGELEPRLAAALPLDAAPEAVAAFAGCVRRVLDDAAPPLAAAARAVAGCLRGAGGGVALVVPRVAVAAPFLRRAARVGGAVCTAAFARAQQVDGAWLQAVAALSGLPPTEAAAAWRALAAARRGHVLVSLQRVSRAGWGGSPDASFQAVITREELAGLGFGDDSAALDAGAARARDAAMCEAILARFVVRDGGGGGGGALAFRSPLVPGLEAGHAGVLLRRGYGRVLARGGRYLGVASGLVTVREAAPAGDRVALPGTPRAAVAAAPPSTWVLVDVYVPSARAALRAFVDAADVDGAVAAAAARRVAALARWSGDALAARVVRRVARAAATATAAAALKYRLCGQGALPRLEFVPRPPRERGETEARRAAAAAVRERSRASAAGARRADGYAESDGGSREDDEDDGESRSLGSSYSGGSGRSGFSEYPAPRDAPVNTLGRALASHVAAGAVARALGCAVDAVARTVAGDDTRSSAVAAADGASGRGIHADALVGRVPLTAPFVLPPTLWHVSLPIGVTAAAAVGAEGTSHRLGTEHGPVADLGENPAAHAAPYTLMDSGAAAGGGGHAGLFPVLFAGALPLDGRPQVVLALDVTGALLGELMARAGLSAEAAAAAEADDAAAAAGGGGGGGGGVAREELLVLEADARPPFDPLRPLTATALLPRAAARWRTVLYVAACACAFSRADRASHSTRMRHVTAPRAGMSSARAWTARRAACSCGTRCRWRVRRLPRRPSSRHGRARWPWRARARRRPPPRARRRRSRPRPLRRTPRSRPPSSRPRARVRRS